MTHQVVALALGFYVFPDQAYDLDLRQATVMELPQTGRRVVTVADTGGQLHLRVFDAKGSLVADSGEASFAHRNFEVTALRTLLAPHWGDPRAMAFKDKATAIKQVTAITGYDPDSERKRNSFINNTIAFVVATVVAYILNVAFVFTSGRHSKRKEIFLFVAVSMVSYVGGMIAVDVVFRFLGDIEALASVTRFLSVIANLGFAVTSAMVNYVCRKFIIFQK